MDTNGNYIQNQFCSYEIALKLKELGFDEPCMGLYYIKNKKFSKTKYSHSNIVKTNDYVIDAPLWQQVIDWFREEKYIIINYTGIYISNIFNPCWTIKISSNGGITSEICHSQFTNTYEEARKQAILKAIELCQK